jgi:hypothetical protein
MEREGCGGDIPNQRPILSRSRILFFVVTGELVKSISSMVFRSWVDIVEETVWPILLMFGIVASKMDDEIEILGSESEIRARLFIN